MTGQIVMLNNTGHAVKTWDTADTATVDAARDLFHDLTRNQAHMAFATIAEVDTKTGETTKVRTQIRDFDPEVEKITMVPPMVGGAR